jgi:hypothetical protein
MNKGQLKVRTGPPLVTLRSATPQSHAEAIAAEIALLRPERACPRLPADVWQPAQFG